MTKKTKERFSEEFETEQEFLDVFDKSQVNLQAIRDLMEALNRGTPFKKCCVEECKENYTHYWTNIKDKEQYPICFKHLKEVEQKRITELLAHTAEPMDDNQIHVAKMWKNVVDSKKKAENGN